MSVKHKLVFSYEDMEGEVRSLSYTGVNPNVDTDTVVDICQALATNGRIFKYGIVTVTGAKLVSETISDFDISGDDDPEE